MLRKTLAPNLCRKIKQYDMWGVITTNGTLFSPQLVDMLVDIGWDQIEFSLDGPNAQVHDMLRGRKGSLDKALQAMERFKQKKMQRSSHLPVIAINMVLTNQNYRLLPDMLDLADKYGAREINLNPLTIFTEQAKPLKLSDAQRSEFTEIASQAQEKAEKLGIGNNLYSFIDFSLVQSTGNMEARIIEDSQRYEGQNPFLGLPCFEPWYMMAFRGNSVGPCCAYKGKGESISDKTLEQVWYGKYFNDIRQRLYEHNLPDFCAQCSANMVYGHRKIRDELKKYLAEADVREFKHHEPDMIQVSADTEKSQMENLKQRLITLEVALRELQRDHVRISSFRYSIPYKLLKIAYSSRLEAALGDGAELEGKSLDFTTSDETQTKPMKSTTPYPIHSTEAKVERLLRWYAGEPQPPYRAELHLTNRCNLKCLSCWHRGTDSEIINARFEPGVARRLVEEASAMGVREWMVSGGGEPLFYENRALDILRIIKSRRSFGQLTTNGILIDDDVAKQLVGMGWDRVQFSIDGAEAATHDRLRAKPGAFFEAVQAARRLVQAKKEARSDVPELVITMVISRDNYRQVPAMFELAHDLGIQGVFFEPLTVFTESQRDMKLSDDDLAALAELYEPSRELAERYHLITDLEMMKDAQIVGSTGEMTARVLSSRPQLSDDPFLAVPCYEPWYSMIIRPAGGIAACCVAWSHGMTIIEKDSLAYTWYKGFFAEFRQRMLAGELPEYCRRCTTGHAKETNKLRKMLSERIKNEGIEPGYNLASARHGVAQKEASARERELLAAIKEKETLLSEYLRDRKELDFWRTTFWHKAFVKAKNLLGI